MTPASSAAGSMLTLSPYAPPAWARAVANCPPRRFNLAQVPTPVHRWHLPGVPDGCEVYVKRDDLTGGAELSGNKVRKLEFLLADAVAEGADCVVTVGAIQSNHCRATAVAARHLGLDAHLILRCPREVADAGDPGFVGNLLVERAVGATIHVVSKREYAERGGGPGLTERVADRLRREGRRPYVIPVGGSDAVGGHGYLRFVDELERQCEDAALDLPTFTHIASACGSGGTTAGIALGCALCPTFRDVGVLAYGVCDAPEYFRAFCRDILLAQGAPSDAIDRALGDPELGDDEGAPGMGMVRFVQAKGAGYAMVTAEEMRYVASVAAETGIVLDPTYGGKAARAMAREMAEDPGAWRGRRVLFVHTGGTLGMFDKVDMLEPLVKPSERLAFD
jgi:D-cysteine desulfhydrase